MIPEITDYGLLADRLMRPERPHRAQALVAVGTRTDPASAWAALVADGLIPRSWATGDGRGFAATCGACRGADPVRRMGCEACWGGGWVSLPYPGTVEACVALASGAEGMAWAEALARSAVRDLGAWGCPQPRSVVWQVGEGPIPGPELLGVGTVVDALTASHVVGDANTDDAGDRAARQILGDASPLEVTRRHQLANYAYVAALWRAACEKGRRVTLGGGIDEQIVAKGIAGTPWSEIANPFVPLLGVWSLGYAIDDVTADDLLLVAPVDD